ncbi:hypothetical protein K151_1709 [Proteus hauseri ZMd44]|nr:hypothetical protein K151_1709 [Proteus hauseri ZMd44]
MMHRRKMRKQKTSIRVKLLLRLLLPE